MLDDYDDAADDEDDAILLAGEFDNQARRVHVPVIVTATTPSLPSDACRRPSDPGSQLPYGHPLTPVAKYCIVQYMPYLCTGGLPLEIPAACSQRCT